MRPRPCGPLAPSAALLAALGVVAARPVPLLGYGTAHIREPGPIVEAIRAGYVLLDTAVLYGNHREVGEAIRRSGVRREEVYVVTKVGFWPRTFLDPLLRRARAWTPRVAEFLAASKGSEAASLAASLEELGLSHVDLCLVHSPIAALTEFLLAYLPHRLGRFAPARGLPRWLQGPVRYALVLLDGFLGVGAAAGQRERALAWRALEEAKERGVCRAIGVSNYALHLLREMESYATEMPTVHELEVHPRFQPRDVLAYCRARGIHVIGYGNGVALESDPGGVVAGVARRAGRSPAQVLLRWALQRNITVLPRSSNRERIRENAGAAEFELPAEDMAALDALDEAQPFYWDAAGIAAKGTPREEREELGRLPGRGHRRAHSGSGPTRLSSRREGVAAGGDRPGRWM